MSKRHNYSELCALRKRRCQPFQKEELSSRRGRRHHPRRNKEACLDSDRAARPCVGRSCSATRRSARAPASRPSPSRLASPSSRPRRRRLPMRRPTARRTRTMQTVGRPPPQSRRSATRRRPTRSSRSGSRTSRARTRASGASERGFPYASKRSDARALTARTMDAPERSTPRHAAREPRVLLVARPPTPPTPQRAIERCRTPCAAAHVPPVAERGARDSTPPPAPRSFGSSDDDDGARAISVARRRRRGAALLQLGRRADALRTIVLHVGAGD